MPNQDKRVLKTRISLERALLKLLKKKSLREIQIKELADEALVSRQTFYQHYEVIEDLYEDCVARILDEIHEESRLYREKFDENVPPYDLDMLENAFSIYYKYAEQLRVLLKIVDKELIMNSIYKNYMSMQIYKEEIYQDQLVHRFAELNFVGGFYMMLKEWIINNPDMTPREFAILYKKAIFAYIVDEDKGSVK